MPESLPDEAIIDEFRRRQKRQLIATIPMLAAMVIVVTGTQSPGPTVLGMPANLAAIAGAVLFVSTIGYTLKNWRCPNCSYYLGKAFNPASCPKCGARFRG